MEVVGFCALYLEQLKRKSLTGYARVAVAMVLERRTFVDRSNDKAKLAAKNGNESGRPIWLAVSVLGDQCHVGAFLPATRRVSWLLFKARATTNLDHQANGTGLA